MKTTLTEAANEGQAQLDRLRQMAPAEVPVLAGWQSIETAPKKGTPVLLYLPDEREWKRYTVGVWDVDRWCGLSPSATGTIWQKQPTHWMLLPEPPTDSTT